MGDKIFETLSDVKSAAAKKNVVKAILKLSNYELNNVKSGTGFIEVKDKQGNIIDSVGMKDLLRQLGIELCAFSYRKDSSSVLPIEKEIAIKLEKGWMLRHVFENTEPQPYKTPVENRHKYLSLNIFELSEKSDYKVMINERSHNLSLIRLRKESFKEIYDFLQNFPLALNTFMFSDYVNDNFSEKQEEYNMMLKLTDVLDHLKHKLSTGKFIEKNGVLFTDWNSLKEIHEYLKKNRSVERSREELNKMRIEISRDVKKNNGGVEPPKSNAPAGMNSTEVQSPTANSENSWQPKSFHLYSSNGGI